MKNIIIFFAIISLLSSCSKDEPEPLTFEFFEFQKDVIEPLNTERSFSLIGLNFDKNTSDWEFQLVDENNHNFPIRLDKIENMNLYFSGGENPQIMTMILPPLVENGTYSLSITNKITSQIYTDYFLVKNNPTFNKIRYDYPILYSIISGWSSNEEPPTFDYFYFHNVKNRINSEISIENVLDIRLENKNTFTNYDIDYTIEYDSQTGKDEITFIIPESIPIGTYYLSVRYDNNTRLYFEKDIILIPTSTPEVISINKNNFVKGEDIIITGSNFDFTVAPSTYPAGKYHNVIIHSYMWFIENQFGFGYYNRVRPTVYENNTKIKMTIPTDYNIFNMPFDGQVGIRTALSPVSDTFQIHVEE